MSLTRLSLAALLAAATLSTQACVGTRQWGRPYPYDYGRGPGYARIAFDAGVRDGYDRGLDDLRHHRRPDVGRQRWYRNGDHDYDRRYGSRDAYRMDYRRGFEQGYDRAYREGYWRN